MVKKVALVSQHLEKISREALERYQGVIREYVRGRQGIYALYSGDKLYYVGLAINLRSRLNIHLKDRHGHSWDYFSVYLTIGDSHLKELESLFLRMFKPVGNKQAGKFVRSEDLQKRFEGGVKEHHRKELALLIGKKKIRKTDKAADRVPDGKQPVLAAYARRPTLLKATYKRKIIRAHVRRDGSIRLDGKVYLSPSMAGAAAQKRRSCNGWTFWTYERAPGDWVLLDELRRFAGAVREHQRMEPALLIGKKSKRANKVPPGTVSDGKQPVLAAYPRRPSLLKATYKGKVIKARVLRNGSIRLNGKSFLSPSMAGAAAQGRRTCNGWTFWTYERAPGDWVLLDELRK